MVKLLMVDDDPEQLDELKKIARRAGIRNVCGATTMLQALDLVRETHFQLAVIDIVLSELPAKLGLELISTLRAQQPDCKIIALTARGSTDFGVEALLSGADDFVSTKWEAISWSVLLEERLRMWCGVIDGMVRA